MAMASLASFDYQQQPEQRQFVPYYEPSKSNTKYQFHSNYHELSPNQGSPQRDQSVETGALKGSVPIVQTSQSQYVSAAGMNTMSFASPPPPTLEDMVNEFGPHGDVVRVESSPLPMTNNGVVGLLDETTLDPSHNAATANPTVGLQTATLLEAEQENQSNGSVLHHVVASPNDIPADIIASQERALAQAKQRTQLHESSNARDGSTSTSLTVPIHVPGSGNPTGSDSVHPYRPQWKKSRGSKTVAGATGGAILGGVILAPVFPVGMVLGGAAGGYAANKLSKAGERRAQRRWEQSNYQKGIEQSPAILADAPFV